MIRDARAGDEAAIYALLRNLPSSRNSRTDSDLTPEIIARDFMGEQNRRVQCEVAEWDGALVGVMIWFRTYGTFSARRLFLEDLFVRPEFRRRGIAKGVLRQLGPLRASHENANRIDWFVLDWNRPAMDFYDRIGARPAWRSGASTAWTLTHSIDWRMREPRSALSLPSRRTASSAATTRSPGAFPKT